MKEKAFRRTAVLAAAFLISICAFAGEGGEALSPDEALNSLKKGNDRFESDDRDYPRQDGRAREKVQDEQRPFAAVLACSDSRIPVEHVFDQGIGDLYVVRVNGNVCGPSEAASLEYAVDRLGVPLVVVLSHGSCDVVAAVLRGDTMKGALAPLASLIGPAAERAKAESKTGATVNEAARLNALKAIEDLFLASPIVRERVEKGRLKVVAAFYRPDDGTVEWIGTHPGEKALLQRGAGGSDARPEGFWILRLIGALGAVVALGIGTALVLMIQKRS